MNILGWEQFDERERVRIGDQAEMYVKQVISSHGEGTLLRGPLIPKLGNNQMIEGYRETDFLVYTQGSIFCVEVKYYSGIISYLPLYQPQQIWNGSQYIQQSVFSGYDDTKILQRKQGKHGKIFEETYPNPLKKTKSFIGLLKKYMAHVEPRFQRLYITPVVCFGEKADISAIYNFEDGMIPIDHLSAFFDHHRNPQFANRSSPWIIDAILNKVPNWDRLQTMNGEWVNGILMAPCLTFYGLDGRLYNLPSYSFIKSLSIQPVWNTPYLEMTITYVNNTVQVVQTMGGEVSLSRGNQPQTYRLHDFQRLVVGLANKLH